MCAGGIAVRMPADQSGGHGFKSPTFLHYKIKCPFNWAPQRDVSQLMKRKTKMDS